MNEKKNWFIYAYPATYGGLHGMYNYEIAFNMSYEEACNWGSELAYETVESYCARMKFILLKILWKNFMMVLNGMNSIETNTGIILKKLCKMNVLLKFGH